MEDYVHLHVHTQYSILDGQASIPRLVDKAINDGMRGMAVTDHGSMMGIKDFFDYVSKKKGDARKALKQLKATLEAIGSDSYRPDPQNKEQIDDVGKSKEELLAKYSKKINKAQRTIDFKPILGCEVYVARHHLKDRNGREDQSGWHLVVLAKNQTGYHNLIKLVSEAWTDGFYMRPRTDHDSLERFHEGLIVSSACLAGEIPNAILKGDIEHAEKTVEWFKKVFGEDFYLELQRHEVKNPRQRANRETFPLQQKVNAVIEQMAARHGVKLICTNDSHFVDQDDAEAHDHLICLSTGKDLDDPSRMLYSKQEWFKTRAEMNEVFPDHPEALRNTCEICDKVEEYSIDHAPIMPTFAIPEDFGTEESYRKKYTERDLFEEFTHDENGQPVCSEEEGREKIDKLGGYEKLYRIKLEADYLAELTYRGAATHYGTPLPNEVAERIKFELHVMKTMGFPGYFLIVQDFINAARNELGVMVGPGRGSAAGSVVAYCLGITKIDPLKYDLLFERFLNPDRVNLPDIDTDFDDDGRGRVLRWVMDKYGHENCAHIITYGSMATKNSIKDVARVEKLPLERSNALCKAIPERLPDGMKMNLTNAIKYTPELQQAEQSDDIRERNTIEYAKKLEGTIRSIGIHACGFIICRDPISDWVPVSTAEDPDFPGLKTAVTQYDGHVIESTGLIKMDFLGLKTLSELKEACKVVKQTTGDVIDLDHIPIDDALTYKLYQEGRTVGTFQFESAGMQKYLRELHPTVFEDLIAMNALYRPGPMDYIPEFIKRKHNPELVTYDIPCMEKYLKDTYGITVYQEQVMLLSRQLANFTRGESDALRKAMGKKKKAIVDAMKPKFIRQGQANGYDPKILEKIWADWEKFASYAFNKSHATCYSWVAYQTAYLKAHYPAEYMAALMTRRFSQITEITKLMEECKSFNIQTLGPDVNESYVEFGVNTKGEIRFGLSAIKGMGTPAAEAIVQERKKNGPYKDIFDFVERADLSSCNRRVIETLVLSGAFDCFSDICREQYFELNNKGETFIEALLHYGQTYQQDQMSNANTLFGDMPGFEITRPDVPPLRAKWTDLDRLNKERDLIGIYLSAHPLDAYSVVLNNICNFHFAEIEGDLADRKGSDLLMGGIVTDVQERISKKGKAFGIVTMEDYEGSGKFYMFGEEWTNYKNYFTLGNVLFIKAAVQGRRWNPDELEFHINEVDYLSDKKEELIQSLTLSIKTSAFDDEGCQHLSTVLKKHHGKASLLLRLENEDGTTHVNLKSKKLHVDVCQNLIRELEQCFGVEYKIN